MNVLVLPSWYPDNQNPLDGVFFKEQVEALSKRGVNITVLSIKIMSLSAIKSNKRKLGLNISIENGVKVYRYYTYNYFPKVTELYLRYYSYLIKKLTKKIIRENPNIKLVHIHSAIDAGIAYNLSKVNIPYIITEHSSKYQRNVLNKTQQKYLKSTFDGARKVIVVGKGLKLALSKYIDRNKIDIIPNLLSLTRGCSDNDNNRTKMRFFSLGVLTKTKGMDILIKAFNSVKDHLKEWELVIGGDGQEYDDLNELIKSYNLQKQVKLIGQLNREEVAYNMKNCDVFVLASRVETFGIVFLEAMIYGKPVIGTRTGGPDTFINDNNGIIVEPENIEQLSKALVEMANNLNKYNSSDIINYCDKNFSEEAICDKIISIYKEVK